MPTVPDAELVSSWEEVDEAALSVKNGLQKAQLAAGVRASLDKADDAVRRNAQATKTATMTQAVGVDANGKLWATPGGSGGGSGLIVVGIYYSDGTYSTDTSSSDIYSAWAAGYVVKARDNLGIEYDLQNITATTATFFGIVDQSNALGAYTFTITGTTVTRYQTRVPVAPVPSASDNGKFLTVSGSAYVLVSIPAAESEAF